MDLNFDDNHSNLDSLTKILRTITDNDSICQVTGIKKELQILLIEKKMLWFFNLISYCVYIAMVEVSTIVHA